MRRRLRGERSAQSADDERRDQARLALDEREGARERVHHRGGGAAADDGGGGTNEMLAASAAPPTIRMTAAALHPGGDGRRERVPQRDVDVGAIHSSLGRGGFFFPARRRVHDCHA